MERNAKAAREIRLLLIPAGICLAAVLVMVWALTRGAGKEAAGFTPPPFEENARQGEPEESEVLEALGYGWLDVKEYRTAVCGAPVVRDGKAILYLTNPASNMVWLKVRILDENGQMLGESGLLRPGEYVEEVGLSTVPKEGAAVQLRIMAYEPETYHSAGAVSLNTVTGALK